MKKQHKHDSVKNFIADYSLHVQCYTPMVLLATPLWSLWHSAQRIV